MAADQHGNTTVNFYLKKLNNQMQRYLYSLYQRKELQDCSLMNMWVCDYLYDRQGQDSFQKDIEAEFFINRATASKMLSLMEEKQLIRRMASDKDARLKKIELLPKGQELHEICVIVRDEMERKITGSLSDEEVDFFKAICRKMSANMEKA